MHQPTEEKGILEKKRELLREVQELEALQSLFKNRLAGPLHDLNNLLNVVSGFSELLSRKLPGGSRERTNSENVYKAVLRAATYIKALQEQFGAGEPERMIVDVNELVNETILLMECQIPEIIRLERRLAPEACLVCAPPLHLQNSVINLIINAREAMPQGGALTLSTEVRRTDRAYVDKRPYARTGDFVAIRVQDTGVGMTEEQKRNLFIPCRSTKGAAGRGLGLFNVLSQARTLDGHVNVESAPGRGACFEICLPRQMHRGE